MLYNLTTTTKPAYRARSQDNLLRMGLCTPPVMQTAWRSLNHDQSRYNPFRQRNRISGLPAMVLPAIIKEQLMKSKKYPILEFDDTLLAKIEPAQAHKKIEGYEYCVITFFRDVLENLEKKGLIKVVQYLNCETMDVPIYEMEYQGEKVHLFLGFLGAAGSAAFLEELIAFGFDKFIVCGGAGVLRKDIAVGHLIIPISAIRDEGVSYHYLAPAREVECNPQVVEKIDTELSKLGIDHIKAKTWTTDAFYRETEKKIELRKSEGCVTVEMEAAALFAVAKFRKVKLGQILYGGDDLSSVKWDGRKWHDRTEVRENLVDIAIRVCLSLG
jgi:uridine phosphorylase